MTEIEAIDIFVESDPSGDDEGPSLISLRVPQDREFARQIRELGGKWDDQTKEWRMEGTEATVKELGNLCKTLFPKLPRRRNRLIAAQISMSEGKTWLAETAGSTAQQVELIGQVEFVVNRTVKIYRLGQNLKWLKEFHKIVELPSPTTGNDSNLTAAQTTFTEEIRVQLRELEQVATTAFEALLVNQKSSVGAILAQAGIEQL